VFDVIVGMSTSLSHKGKVTTFGKYNTPDIDCLKQIICRKYKIVHCRGFLHRRHSELYCSLVWSSEWW